MTPAIPTSGDAQARQRFQDAQRLIERDGGQAVVEFEAIVEEFPEDPIVPWARFYAGMAAVKAGQYDQAIANLEALDEDDDADERLARRGLLYLGLARVYSGQYDQARGLLEKNRDAIDGDDERLEWTAAMAEAIGNGEKPLDAVRYYDDWYSEARQAEKLYIVARIRALVRAASGDAALAAYESASKRDTPGSAILGLRAASELAARGERDRATRIRERAARIFTALDLGTTAADRSGGDRDKLGAILPLSGRRERAGELAMRGIALAAGTFEDARSKDIQPFQVLVRDTASTAEGARSAVDALAAGGAIALVGPIDGDSVDAAASQAQAAGVPLISFNPRSGQRARSASPYIFHIVQSAEDRAEALARYAHDKGVTRLAVLRPQSGYGKAVASAFRATTERLGGQIVVEETYDRQTKSFVAVAKTLARASWDAVFIPDQAEQLELIAPALAAVDLLARPLDSKERVRRGRKILLLSTAEFVAPNYLRSSGRYSEGAVLAPGFYPDRTDSIISDFVDRYEQSFGQLPTALDAYAYDAAWLVRKAVESGATSRADLAEALATSNLAGLTGTITFDDSRRRSDRGLLFTVVRSDGDYAITAVRE